MSLKTAYADARNEAAKAFGNDTVFLEKFIESPKHVEVQILGDNEGNLVHLFERDCSVQRRFQKVVEVAPSFALREETRQKLFEYALAITRHVNYSNAGTVEFLVDKQENIYFIEVNPRIQVEHTITEQITGIDIVRSQIQIARGCLLADPEIRIKTQADVECRGYSIQCRITTEDPENGFQPDYGTLIAYRSAAGFGIRLDVGAAYTGAQGLAVFRFDAGQGDIVGPHPAAVQLRATTAPCASSAYAVSRPISAFCRMSCKHPTFASGEATVAFIDSHPELFEISERFDRATKTLRYIANLTVNGNPDIGSIDPKRVFRKATVPHVDRLAEFPPGTKNKLDEMGPEAFCSWVRQQKHIMYTDTTLRDAHQSLLATRVRTLDMLAVAEGFAKANPQVFSLEMWGGATFDVSLRFLRECPWQRLQQLRQAVPNILLQMLFRGSNAVGYKAYPDNVIEKFIEKSWENGIDVFRIFDSLNWIEGMKRSIQIVRERTGGIAEATICYTGDVLNTDPGNRYNMQYYLDMARRLEDEGAHMLALKDMAGSA